MTDKVPQTTEQLQEQLREQISFLEKSATMYDEGDSSEAKRLAHTLRVLLHDSETSYSLLGQLDLKSNPFWSTAQPFDPMNIMPYCGLVQICLTGSGAYYMPFLDQLPHGSAKQVDFTTWWSEVVFIDKHKTQFNRRDIVLFLSDQDGGSHVDPALDPGYSRLSRQESLTFSLSVRGKKVLLVNPERAAVRQIAHEVLKSLKLGYAKVLPAKKGAVMLANPSLRPGGPPSTPPGSVPLRYRPVKPVPANVRRNEPCPCGSGIKFKRCCGKGK